MIEETATNQTTASTNTPQKQHVLIIGGTNFMGKELTQRLADDPAVDVHIINRQKLHWNNEWRKIQNVTFHYGDRDTHLEFIKMLKYISKKIGITEESSKKWSLVIDFCAYLRKEVKSVIRALSRRLDLYVLISTDSVYDVCDETIRHRPVKESDDIRPHLDKDVKKKAEDEDYGHDKLKCEEYLRNHVSDLRDGFPFVCLRLPDVIGPYDSTCRYWAYVIWIQQMVKKPVHTHRESREEKLSFVYSKDVATICITLLGKVRDRGWVEGVHGESFNIAFEENPTLDELVVMIGKSMGHDTIVWKDQSELKGHGKYYYPSVDCGYIDITKAKKMIGWSPSPLEQSISETTQFFTNIPKGRYNKERKVALRKFDKVNKYYPDVV